MSPPVFDRLVGQPEVVDTLTAAAAAAGRIVVGEPVAPGDMTHAWIFTGPPGSGRSVAARAFAAALQCPRGGCDACTECHTAMTGTHADVKVVVPDGLTIGVDFTRELVRRAASSSAGGRWQVILIEDADRLTEQAADALLKAVEEPSPRTVFLLCSPSVHPDDVRPTIRSRCRVLTLRTPAADAVAAMLTRDGVPAAKAQWAAAAAQGHIGRAKRLVADEQAQGRRAAVLRIPRGLTGIGAAFDAAAALAKATEAEAKEATEEADAKEKAELELALGGGGTGKGVASVLRGAAGALADLQKRQERRRTRTQRDALDRALVDLAGFYRDVLAMRLGAPVPPVHVDAVDDTTAAATTWTAEGALRRLEAVLACRVAIEANVRPLIALESMMVTLWQG